MSVVDELRKLDERLHGFPPYGEPDLDELIRVLPALLDVVEAAEWIATEAVQDDTVKHPYYGPAIIVEPGAWFAVKDKLAVLESAQGAEQRPETGAGA